MYFHEIQNNPELLKTWFAACEEYLETLPEHKSGFCNWAFNKGIRFAYDIGCGYLNLYKNSQYAISVTPKPGPVPERIAFVKWMLQQKPF